MTSAFTGTNAFQIQQQTQKLQTAFKLEHGDLALEKLQASEVEYAQILGAIESLPFLATKKMVVLYDLSLNKEAAEQLDTLVERADNTIDLLIIEAKIDKRGTYFKALKKLTDFHELNEMDEATTLKWLVDQANKLSANIQHKDAQYLVQRVGNNQLRLSNELKKLAQFNSRIDHNTIDALTDENPSSTIFNLVDSIFTGNARQAIHLYEEQRMQRVEPQAIHGMLVWQMHVVAIVAAAPGGTNYTQIAKDAGLSPYVVQKSQRIAKNMGRNKIIECMKLLRDIDYRGKHEIFDYDEALRYTIVKLAAT